MRVVLLAGAFLVVAACSSFGSAADAPAGADGGVDAGVDSPVVEVDGASEGGSGKCTVLLTDDFATQKAGWKATGSEQKFEPNQLVLTPAGKGGDGAVWWSAALTYADYLRVRVEFHTETPGGQIRGNGFAVTWADVAGGLPTMIGGLGESFGVCSATPPIQGYAFGGSTTKDQIVIVQTAVCDTNIPEGRATAALDGDHFFAFEVRPTKIAGSLDGTVPLSRADLAPAAVTRGFFGMSAGASGAQTAHVIKRVLLESCRD